MTLYKHGKPCLKVSSYNAQHCCGCVLWLAVTLGAWFNNVLIYMFTLTWTIHMHVVRVLSDHTVLPVYVSVCVLHGWPSISGLVRRVERQLTFTWTHRRWFQMTPQQIAVRGSHDKWTGSGGPHCLFRPLVSDTVPTQEKKKSAEVCQY